MDKELIPEGIPNNMPKKRKVLVLGSGPIKIGQAGEFDYSGSQALKALREEGVETVLVNPNIATIQTSEIMADRIYFLPVNDHFVEKIIEKERPDGILLSFGGQTALNCGVSLHEKGILKKYGVDILGTPIKTVMETEDRDLFIKKLKSIGVGFARAVSVKRGDDIIGAGRRIGYPLNLRPSYVLGGEGSGICRNEEDLRELSSKVFTVCDSVLMEESLEGWKEIEYEIMRDRYNNIVFVCDMENFDPMGIHTGDSIVVVPSQTLSEEDKERLKRISKTVIESIGVIGECNIQLALNPENGDIRVVEVNARLSRSSALASKATGCPLAFIATKLALGYGLHQLRNGSTGKDLVDFELTADYVVCKVPRWDFDKFDGASKTIGTSMKSVGEVMAVSESFEEAIQKGMRMADNRNSGFGTNKKEKIDRDREIDIPSDKRMLSIEAAFRKGESVDKIHQATGIDRFFLFKLKGIFDLAEKVASLGREGMDKDLLLEAKRKGFSDAQLASLIGLKAEDLRELRKRMGIIPSIKRIETVMGDRKSESEYLYLTYDTNSDNLSPEKEGESVVVLGSGVYRIGSSVEFDWSSVSAVEALRVAGFRAIMINCNPETVSTDHDVCDRLYFEELTLERVLDILDFEGPKGVVVSVGGQSSNDLALPLHKNGAKILGTPASSIDKAEDRQKFSEMLDELGIEQPRWRELSIRKEAEGFVKETGFPVIIRPSYVLSGSGMRVIHDFADFDDLLKEVVRVSAEHPVVISEFINGATELEIDAVAKHGSLLNWGISEHVELAGTHSGDATLVHPPQNVSRDTQDKIVKIAELIAEKLQITGPFNVQILVKEDSIWVMECNLRASRSLPFISKVTKKSFMKSAISAIMGKGIEDVDEPEINGVGIKVPQFSFSRLSGADSLAGVEMRSTGEAACLGRTREEAFLKSMISVGYDILFERILLSMSIRDVTDEFVRLCGKLSEKGYVFYLNREMRDLFNEKKIGIRSVSIEDKDKLKLFQEEGIGLSIITTRDGEHRPLRRLSADFNIPLITDMSVAELFLRSVLKLDIENLEIESWDRYYR